VQNPYRTVSSIAVNGESAYQSEFGSYAMWNYVNLDLWVFENPEPGFRLIETQHSGSMGNMMGIAMTFFNVDLFDIFGNEARDYTTSNYATTTLSMSERQYAVDLFFSSSDDNAHFTEGETEREERGASAEQHVIIAGTEGYAASQSLGGAGDSGGSNSIIWGVALNPARSAPVEMLHPYGEILVPHYVSSLYDIKKNEVRI
jgi:hypothetical protein